MLSFCHMPYRRQQHAYCTIIIYVTGRPTLFKASLSATLTLQLISDRFKQGHFYPVSFQYKLIFRKHSCLGLKMQDICFMTDMITRTSLVGDITLVTLDKNNHTSN